MGVFDAIEREEEAVAAGADGSVEQVFECEEFALAQEGDDALVGVGLAVAGELVAGLGGDADAFGARQSSSTARVRGSRRASRSRATLTWSICRSTRADGLFHGVQAVKTSILLVYPAARERRR